MVDSYKNFTKWKKHKYSAYQLAEELSVNVCPYCNRSTTFTIREGEDPLIRPEFDHFYNKNSHPVLALSFYNLIPSCHTCNSNLKGAKKFTLDTHIHPYWDDFHSEFSFEIIPNRVSMSETGHFKLGFNTASDKARKTLKDFHIETLYQRHKDSVLDQIKKAQIYDDALIDAIFQQHKILFETRSDVVRLVTGAIENREEIAKRPLAKLAHDIAVELKRLKN